MVVASPKLLLVADTTLQTAPTAPMYAELNLELVVLLAYIWLPVTITGPIYSG